MDEVVLDDLPVRDEVRQALRHFLREAGERTADQLEAVILYGSTARGELSEARLSSGMGSLSREDPRRHLYTFDNLPYRIA